MKKIKNIKEKEVIVFDTIEENFLTLKISMIYVITFIYRHLFLPISWEIQVKVS